MKKHLCYFMMVGLLSSAVHTHPLEVQAKAEPQKASTKALSGKKGAKALPSTKTKAAVKKVKKLALKGQTPATKSVKLGMSYKKIEKILGKASKIHAPIKNVAYQYPTANILIDSQYDEYKDTWVPSKNSKVNEIEVKLPKNKAYAYKDIKAVLGTNHTYAPYGHRYGYQILYYTYKNITILFYSTIYEDRDDSFELKLSNDMLFDRYVITKF